MLRNRYKFDEKGLFLAISLAICLILSLRPIPEAYSKNDTVRYIEDLQYYCSGNLHKDLPHKDISYKIYYAFMSPACLTGSDRILLFQSAFILPLMFLIFSKWNTGSFIWATSMLLSVYGLDLMTNALRQTFALAIFFISVAIADRKRLLSICIGIFAVLAHHSIAAYIPYLLMIGRARLSRSETAILVILSVSLAGLFYIAYINYLPYLIADIISIKNTFAEIYGESINLYFMFFILSPLYLIYLIRYIIEKDNISKYEKISILYSTIIIVACYILFPLIAFRFAVLSVALQIYMITMAGAHNKLSAVVGFTVLILHLVIMIIMTNQLDIIFYG